MKFNAVFYMMGRLLLIVGAFMLLPAVVAWYYGEKQTLNHFIVVSSSACALGCLCLLQFRGARDEAIAVKDGFLLVTLSWLMISFLGALPFYASGYFPKFVDALFESISGFTTTGASILADIEALPRGLLFWRDFTHWIGGMGIIVLAVAVLPQLSVGGMQLMKNEMPGPTFETLKPRIKQTALTLWKVYVLFSILQVLALHLAGMPLFDSVCHMFGSMGTGGFSTRNASIGAYESTRIQMIIAFFMFLAGMNFVLHYHLIRGRPGKMFADSEWKFYVSVVSIAIIAISADLYLQGNRGIQDAARLSIFQVLTIASTTGFATDNFDAWPYFSKGILFLIMVVGGCAGSTAGGIKQVRLQLLFKKAKQSIVQHIYPKAVVSVKLNGKVVPEAVLTGVSNLFLIYLVIFSFSTLFLLAYNFDFVTSTSAVIACLSNIGPGFGQVGAAQNYAFLPDAAKLVLGACMIIGRLEIYTVLVLFFPATWKR